jgi:hypothetical protein
MQRAGLREARPALWVGMEAELAAQAAQRRAAPAPAPTPLEIARRDWVLYHHAGEVLPWWWYDRAENERRFRAEHPHLFEADRFDA